MNHESPTQPVDVAQPAQLLMGSSAAIFLLIVVAVARRRGRPTVASAQDVERAPLATSESAADEAEALEDGSSKQGATMSGAV